jgi:hypothetical protein
MRHVYFVIQDIYNVRPLPFIIGTKHYNESDDAGLGGVGFDAGGGFAGDGAAAAAAAEDPHARSEQAEHATAITEFGENETGMRHSGSESDEDYGAQQQQQQQHKGRPPPPPAKVRFTDENDDEDGDDYADETVVGGGNNGGDSDNDDEGTGASSRPVARTNTGNPLKDMLNAQIAAKGRGAGALPNSAATTSARTRSVSSDNSSAGDWNNSNNSNNKNSSAAAAPAKSSNWDDDNSDEDSTAGGNNSSAADATRNKANLADIIGRSHASNVAKPPASTANTAVARESLKGDPEADSGKEDNEDNEDDGGDLFAANDDPFGLFGGGAKTSAFARVRKVQLFVFLCFCFLKFIF